MAASPAKIIGYADRFSAQPGETIRFMVSCELPAYRAEIVRLIHGDSNPAGPGFKEEPVPTSVGGGYRGRRQEIHAGSYVVVPDSPVMEPVDGLTIQAWILPTTPEKGLQGIVTKWSSADGAGYGLFIGDGGDLELRVGGIDGVRLLGTGATLRASQWYFVAASYDAEKGLAALLQRPSTIWPDDSAADVQAVIGPATPSASGGPAIIGGYWLGDDDGPPSVAGHFNGKIDSPKLFGRALTAPEIEGLRLGGPSSSGLETEALAWWDFARDFSTAHVEDRSGNGLHGRTVNMPGRAFTGHDWDGSEACFRHAPEQYGAIYLHDDDLEDAGWDADFELRVPERMRSGVYAARLEADGAVDHVPFFVRPKRGTATAPILFLAPTATYLAYAGFHGFASETSAERYEQLIGRPLKLDFPGTPEEAYAVENRLLSMYDRHSDGSGVTYSSRLRPIPNMRPGYRMPLLGLGEGHPYFFSADLHLVDWLESQGYEYDVATDDDLHTEGEELLAPYLTMVTGTHPEYWSGAMLDALESYLAGGGRLMYLGGNGFYWVTSYDRERPHVIEVRRWHGTETYEAEPGEYYHSTTGELGGLWRFRGRPPQRLVGVGFTSQGFDYSLPYERRTGSADPRAAFIFEGVDPDEPIGGFGLVMGGAGGLEVDRVDEALGTPPHALVLATSTGFSDVYQHAVEEIVSMNPGQGGSENPLVRADMVYMEGPNGGAVFSVGSISWCGSLSHNGYDNNVSRITGNVLRRFSSEEPVG